MPQPNQIISLTTFFLHAQLNPHFIPKPPATRVPLEFCFLTFSTTSLTRLKNHPRPSDWTIRRPKKRKKILLVTFFLHPRMRFRTRPENSLHPALTGPERQLGWWNHSPRTPKFGQSEFKDGIPPGV